MRSLLVHTTRSVTPANHSEPCLHRRTAASFPFFRRAIYNGAVYTILSETYVFVTVANRRQDRLWLPGSAEVEIVVPMLQQDVGSVLKADHPGLQIGERSAVFLIVVLFDARFPFVQLRRDLLLFFHPEQHLPRLLHRLYLGQIAHPADSPFSPEVPRFGTFSICWPVGQEIFPRDGEPAVGSARFGVRAITAIHLPAAPIRYAKFCGLPSRADTLARTPRV
jgi:hypothetical protein